MHTEQRQKNKVKKVRSIGTRMTIIFSAVLIVALAACWVANIFFLQDYYIKNKLMAIKEAYEYMDEASKADNLSGEKFLAGLRTICETDNISLFVMDQNGRARLTSVHDSEELQRDLYEYVLGIRPNQKSILAENDQYLMSVNRDSPNGGYLKMAGVLSGGEPFIIRTAVEPIRESVSLANRFLIYVGSIVLLVGAFIIHWVSKRISEPILELARLSERMSDLDFDVKFEGGRDSEIIFLGNHMNQLSETLEKTISELKTANNELQRDIEQKEKRDEMRKEFLSNVSHELKTPLTSMKVLADSLLMQEEVPNELYREFMQDIAEEIDRENTIISDLLTLVKMDRKTQELNIAVTDVNEFMETILKRLRPIAEKANVEVVFESNRSVSAEIDASRLSLAFSNLVENAIKYNVPQGKVWVTTRRVGDRVRLEVADTGVGIPQEDMPKIFQRFYRVDKARSRAAGGTGLGLSIVRDAVRRHGGEITVAPRTSAGVVFTVLLLAEEGGAPS